MAGERFGMKAQEKLAAYIEANLATHLAAVEVAQGLADQAIGRPSVVLRGFHPADPRNNRVEVYWHEGGPRNAIDRQLFAYDCEADFTLHAADGDPLELQKRMGRWETAWWLLMSKGGSTLGGTVNGAVCMKASTDSSRTKTGHIAVLAAMVTVTIQEN